MKQFSVLVIGDSCDDEYIYGDCSRLNPEGPIPVLDRTSAEVKPGMAYTQKLYKREGGLVVDIFKPLC